MSPTKLIAALALVAAPAVAQDLPVFDFNGALHDARVTGRLVRQAQQREAGKSQTARATRGQAEACAKKQVFRDMHGATDARVQKLYSLCRNVGL